MSSERRDTPEKALERSNNLLRAITKAQSEFITNVDPRKLFDNLLENLLSVTESEYGFIGEVLHDASGTVYLKTHAVTNIAWNEETKKIYEKNAYVGLEFRNLKTLFGAVLSKGEPVISNDPKNDPRSGGLPQGHPPLNKFMGLPFFSGKEFVGMVGIANRSGGYDEQVIQFLRPFLTTCGNIIHAFRADRQRIKTEESLRQSETENRTILKTVASGIITIDGNRIIRDFNPAAEKIFGYSAPEVLRRNVKLLMPEPYHTMHDEYVKNYLQTGEKKVIGIGREVRGKRKDGSTFPLELAVNEMLIGDERMFVGVLTDITSRKQTEESLIAARDAAENANRIKSEFINMISHELRTPLTVILGNAPLLTNPEDMPDPKEISEIAKDIETDGNHLLTLINDLLDISKIEAGKMQVCPEPVSASLIVDEALATVTQLANQKSLFIEKQITEMEILADSVRMKQILFNLLGNAIKFTDAGGIVIQAFPKGNMARFTIRDTGCGMNESDLPYIFDVFRQVDSSSTRKASGTGLGLFITKRLVEMHGGKIWVKSRKDEGSIFIFTIPLAKNVGWA